MNFHSHSIRKGQLWRNSVTLEYVLIIDHESSNSYHIDGLDKSGRIWLFSVDIMVERWNMVCNSVVAP